jgi:hypothetical protein
VEYFKISTRTTFASNFNLGYQVSELNKSISIFFVLPEKSLRGKFKYYIVKNFLSIKISASSLKNSNWHKTNQ